MQASIDNSLDTQRLMLTGVQMAATQLSANESVNQSGASMDESILPGIAVLSGASALLGVTSNPDDIKHLSQDEIGKPMAPWLASISSSIQAILGPSTRIRRIILQEHSSHQHDAGQPSTDGSSSDQNDPMAASQMVCIQLPATNDNTSSDEHSPSIQHLALHDLDATERDCMLNSEPVVVHNSSSASAAMDTLSEEFVVAVPLALQHADRHDGSSDDDVQLASTGCIVFDGVSQSVANNDGMIQLAGFLATLISQREIERLHRIGLRSTVSEAKQAARACASQNDGMHRLFTAMEHLLRHRSVDELQIATTHLAGNVCGADSSALLHALPDGTLRMRCAPDQPLLTLSQGIAYSCYSSTQTMLQCLANGSVPAAHPNYSEKACQSILDALHAGHFVSAASQLAMVVPEAMQDPRLHPEERICLPVGGMVAIPLLSAPVSRMEDYAAEPTPTSSSDETEFPSTGRELPTCNGVLLLATRSETLHDTALRTHPSQYVKPDGAAVSLSLILARGIEYCANQDASLQSLT